MEALIKRRTARVGRRLLEEVRGFTGWLLRNVAWPVFGRCWAQRAVVDKVRATLDRGLDALDNSYREG